MARLQVQGRAVTPRDRIHRILNGKDPHWGNRLEFAVMALIAISVVSIGVETLPGLPRWLDAALADSEIAIVSVFSAEYLLRAWSAPDRRRYLFSFYGLIDALAVAPFLLGLLFGTFGLDLRAVRALRLLRLFRLLKMVRYTSAMERLREAFRTVREEVIVFSVASVTLLYLFALVVYHLENEAQPEVFSSVLDAMWWTAVTLTTVGYGDIYPITPLGRLFTVLMLFVALGFIAVPTGLVASALTAIRRRQDPPTP